MHQIEKEVKTKMKEALEHFKKELSLLRTGRANPGIFEGVQVEVYGTQMRIKELGNVTAAEARQVLITPFDPQTAAAIAKGIEKANLNVKPVVDGHVVRISIPPLDEAMRKDIVKQGKKKAEEAKIAIREIRRKGNDTARKQKAEALLAEDEMKKLEKTIQEQTDEHCSLIDTLFAAKEKEVMTV